MGETANEKKKKKNKAELKDSPLFPASCFPSFVLLSCLSSHFRGNKEAVKPKHQPTKKTKRANVRDNGNLLGYVLNVSVYKHPFKRSHKSPFCVDGKREDGGQMGRVAVFFCLPRRPASNITQRFFFFVFPFVFFFVFIGFSPFVSSKEKFQGITASDKKTRIRSGPWGR